MGQKRRSFTAGFKARVALEALKEVDTVQGIAQRNGLHPNQVGACPRACASRGAPVLRRPWRAPPVTRPGCLVPIISGHRSLPASHHARKLYLLQGIHSPEHILFSPSNCPRNGEHLNQRC